MSVISKSDTGQNLSFNKNKTDFSGLSADKGRHDDFVCCRTDVILVVSEKNEKDAAITFKFTPTCLSGRQESPKGDFFQAVLPLQGNEG